MEFDKIQSSLTNTDNRENDLLVRDEGPNYGINGSFGSPEEKCNVNFSTAKTKFREFWLLRYNCIKSHLFRNWKEIFKFKANNNNVTCVNFF